MNFFFEFMHSALLVIEGCVRTCYVLLVALIVTNIGKYTHLISTLPLITG
jgi:hypothetical protein